MKKINKYKPLANQLEQNLSDLVNIVNENLKLDKLNFNDKMSLDHYDLHSGNIIVDGYNLEIKAIIDWEWANYGFDDNPLNFFKKWYFSQTEKYLISEMVSRKTVEHFEIMNGGKIRKQLMDLFDPIEEFSFVSPICFKLSFQEIKLSDDLNLNIRILMDHKANKAKEIVLKMPEILKFLKNYD